MPTTKLHILCPLVAYSVAHLCSCRFPEHVHLQQSECLLCPQVALHSQSQTDDALTEITTDQGWEGHLNDVPMMHGNLAAPATPSIGIPGYHCACLHFLQNNVS